MRLAVLQFDPVTGACEANAQRLVELVKKAAEQGAELCIAPELALCGPNPMDFLLRHDFIQSCQRALEYLTSELGGHADLPALLLGAPLMNPVPHGKQLHNCAVLIDKGKQSVVSRKVIIPCDNALNDGRYFEAGLFSGVLQYKGWRFIVTIGEDLGKSANMLSHGHDFDPVSEVMQSSGGDVVLNLAATPFTQEFPRAMENALASLARQHHVPVVFANLCGGFDSQVLYGGSFMAGIDAKIIARAGYFAEEIFLVDLGDFNSLAPAAPPVLCNEELLWDALVLGVRDYGKKCGFNKAMLGVSGGIDSALVLAIAAEAFGPENVTGVMMPSKYSSQGSVDDSLMLAQKLGVKTVTLPILPMVESFTSSLALVREDLKGLTEENLQARIRGTLLMAYAGEEGAVVLNASNKSETACGYSTLYGDSVGALCPIADIFKLQVYEVCRWLNETRGEIIPEIILEKEPSAELAPDQKDTDSLPPYTVLDGILKMLIEQGYGVDEIVGEGYSLPLVQQIVKMVQRARFKRQQAPTVLQMSKFPLALVWRTPIACSVAFG